MKKILLSLIALVSLWLGFSSAYKVTEIIDWDTIKVSNGSWTILVWLIGVKAPEITTTKLWYIECFWKESKDYLSWLVMNKEVRLVFDRKQTKDSEKRTMAYVLWTWKTDYNSIMISDWYWLYLKWSFNKSFKYNSLSNKSKKSKLWIFKWNICSVSTWWMITYFEEKKIIDPKYSWENVQNELNPKIDNTVISTWVVLIQETYHTYVSTPKWECYYIDTTYIPRRIDVDKKYCK